MDLVCQRCGEPYDVLSLKDDMDPLEESDFRRGRHCPACKDKTDEEIRDRAEATRELREAQAAAAMLMPDDPDGQAAMLDTS